MNFIKMQSAGNDYIFTDTFDCGICGESALAVKLSKKHFGVGSDGLVVIGNSKIADFKMTMYNADGSLGLMCGNAACCVGKYLFDKGCLFSDSFTLETSSGVRKLRVNTRDSKYFSTRVDMGKPEYKEIIYVHGKNKNKLIFVKVGNPHCVVFCSDPSKINVRQKGRAIENSRFIPEPSNVEFVRVIDYSSIKMRVWERGSGETLSCGTGSCAAAVAATVLGKIKENVPISVSSPGGMLEVLWDRCNNNLFLTGKGKTVFHGSVKI